MNQQVLLSKFYILKGLVGAGLLAGLLLSPNLWVTGRLYPLTPLIPFSPPAPPLDSALFWLMLIFLAWFIILPDAKIPAWIFVGLATIAVIFDQSRLQPWFYQYSFMLIATAIYTDSGDNHHKSAQLWDVLRIIIAGVYFWSGVQKLNFAFLTSVAPWMAEPLTRLGLLGSAVSVLVILTPIIEIAIALGLLWLWQPYKKVLVATAVMMHVVILFAIGPWGHNWNSVVWPWNIAMALFAVVLFWNFSNTDWKKFILRSGLFPKIIFILFGIMPLLNFFGLWDSYLSFALYSGTTKDAYILMDEKGRKGLPGGIEKFIETTNKGTSITIFNWSIDELSVPPYPEDRIFKKVAKSICSYTANNTNTLLVIKEYQRLNTSKENFYGCSEL